ncbi:MAG TPA: DNA-binding response regulator [Methylophilaceae bacterium]|nr:DNA-binding response regulator [Methylophilaceae bacterium]HAJ70690.1 DNA-binding response regulator [Methylophilaceae bacterium]
MSKDVIKIMLVDDHAVVRSGLRRLMENQANIVVTVEAENGEQAYQLFSLSKVDVIVMDLSMPGMGGLESARRIIGRYPSAKIIIFSMHDNATFASQVLKAGVKGYVTKTGADSDLIKAVQEVAKGKTYLSPEVAQKIVMENMVGEDNPLNVLSAREFEVFRLLTEGVTTEGIGTRLKISQKTVANYHTMIKQKLGVNSPIEMVRLALRFGVIES